MISNQIKNLVSKKAILVADRRRELADEIKKCFLKEKIKIITCEDISLAKDFLKENIFSILIVDMNTGGSLKIKKFILEIDSGSETPPIILTSTGDFGELSASEFLTNPKIKFLKKPYSLSDLCESVSSLIGAGCDKKTPPKQS